MRKEVAVCLAVLVLSVWFTSTSQGQAGPEFRLGFKALADQIPAIAGQPLEDECWGTNGDSLQRTTTGLMAWRKADNWTAFTNGSRSWVNGPLGVMERGNDERFEWEATAPVGGPPSPPPSIPTAPASPISTPVPVVSPTPVPTRSSAPVPTPDGAIPSPGHQRSLGRSGGP